MYIGYWLEQNTHIGTPIPTINRISLLLPKAKV